MLSNNSREPPVIGGSPNIRGRGPPHLGGARFRCDRNAGRSATWMSQRGNLERDHEVGRVFRYFGRAEILRHQILGTTLKSAFFNRPDVRRFCRSVTVPSPAALPPNPMTRRGVLPLSAEMRAKLAEARALRTGRSRYLRGRRNSPILRSTHVPVYVKAEPADRVARLLAWTTSMVLYAPAYLKRTE